MPSPLPLNTSPTGTSIILPPEPQPAFIPSPLCTHHNSLFAHPVEFGSREHENHCSTARMEQSVLDFIKSMLMDEEKLPDAHTWKPSEHKQEKDIEDHAHAVVLYKAIMKDFCDIVTEHDIANGRNTNCSSTPHEFIDQSVHVDPFNYYSTSINTSLLAAGGDSLHPFNPADHPFNEPEVTGMESLHSSARDGTLTVSDRRTAAGHCDQIADSIGDEVYCFQSERRQSSSDSGIEFGRWAEQVLNSVTTVTNVDPAQDLQQPVHVVQKEQRQGRTLVRDYTDSKKMNIGARDLRRQQENIKMEKPDISFVEDLGKVIEAEYENLYAGDVSSMTKPADGRGIRGCRPPGANSNSSSKRKKSASVSAPGYYDLEELLISCAQAISRSEISKARELLQEMERLGVSAKGRSCLHRMVFHFCRALKARLDGSGAALYAAAELAATNFTAAESIRSWIYTFDRWHYMKISHFFANQTFLEASHGRKRLHIVDYGICYGMQWPHFIKALGERDTGPPFLIITGVQFSKSAKSICDESASATVAETGQRLADFAAACNVPFRFHGVASSNWEDLDAESLGIELDRRSDTALFVNVMRQMFFLPDEMSTVQDEICDSQGWSQDKNRTSTRQKLLCRIRKLSPDVLVFGELNARFNVPTSFLTRFKETLQLFESVFEMMERTMEDRRERQMTESVSAKWIVNVVACEGADRVIRPETYQRWQKRLEMAGFEQLQVPERLLQRSAAYVNDRYHKDFTVMEDDKSPWLLLGWRGRTFMATSAWKPTVTPTSSKHVAKQNGSLS